MYFRTGLSNMTAIIIFSYLYHNFLLPIRASYVLGWTSCLLMMLGSSLSYCFSRQESEGTLSITPENNINGSSKVLILLFTCYNNKDILGS